MGLKQDERKNLIEEGRLNKNIIDISNFFHPPGTSAGRMGRHGLPPNSPGVLAGML